MADRAESREIQTAADTARHVGQHLMRTGGTVGMGESALLSIGLLLADAADAHTPYQDRDGLHCERDDDTWPCTDVRRAHAVAQLVNAAWPRPAAAEGEAA
ncbi:hypothetical protein GCM10010400_76170 [Streptomyces aculeolatus]|uniref:hypothetical protein n=1 Tax=Streptomyces aculeolatus TaxID=270689 RepID=UPI001CEC0994|nr:hypothetical protein [Streptomyces aculeolatus]